MATELYMDNYTKQFQTEPPDLVSAVDCQASLRAIHDKVITTADFNSGDVIYAARPPKGWKWSGHSTISYGALGANVTLAVGTSITGAGAPADPNKFLGPMNSATLGNHACNVIDSIGYEFDGETDVIVTIGGADCDPDIPIVVEFEFYAVN